jgi:hypothetical protein
VEPLFLKSFNFFFFFTAYSDYPELWILRYPAHRYRAVPSPGFEPTTLWLKVRRPNHSATPTTTFYLRVSCITFWNFLKIASIFKWLKQQKCWGLCNINRNMNKNRKQSVIGSSLKSVDAKNMKRFFTPKIIFFFFRVLGALNLGYPVCNWKPCLSGCENSISISLPGWCFIRLTC